MQTIHIISGVRTAVGDFGGALKGFMPSDLGQLVAAEAISRAGVAPGDIGHVVIGQVMQTSARDNMLARAARAWRDRLEGGHPCRRACDDA